MKRLRMVKDGCEGGGEDADEDGGGEDDDCGVEGDGKGGDEDGGKVE